MVISADLWGRMGWERFKGQTLHPHPKPSLPTVTQGQLQPLQQMDSGCGVDINGEDVLQNV